MTKTSRACLKFKQDVIKIVKENSQAPERAPPGIWFSSNRQVMVAGPPLETQVKEADSPSLGFCTTGDVSKPGGDIFVNVCSREFKFEQI